MFLLYAVLLPVEAQQKKEKFDFSDIDFEESVEDEWQEEDGLESEADLAEEWSAEDSGTPSSRKPKLEKLGSDVALDDDLNDEEEVDVDVDAETSGTVGADEFVDLDSDLEDDDIAAEAAEVSDADIADDDDIAGDDNVDSEIAQDVILDADIAGDNEEDFAVQGEGEIPLALQESLEDPMAEEISRLFHRVPLKPPMSEANWKKWAGPALEKIYRVRTGDNLWVISERFFGTPYLWPKIWQLNAYLGNPNILEPGMILKFDPGNPFAGPNLAFKLGENEVGYLPPLVQEFRRSSEEKSFEEEMMDLQPATDIRSFYLKELPRRLGRLPDKREGGFIYSEQNEFDLFDIEDGLYRLIRYKQREWRLSLEGRGCGEGDSFACEDLAIPRTYFWRRLFGSRKLQFE